MSAAITIKTRADWARLVAGLAIVYLLCWAIAESLRSYRGEWGVAIAAIAIVALLIVEMIVFGRTAAGAWRALGLTSPAGTGVRAAAGLSAALILIIPLFAISTGEIAGVHPNAMWLALGLFAQAGVFEETLFRGYLFGRIREGRGFWQAAVLASLPFVAVHLVMFTNQNLYVALFSVALAFALSFPLARLYELGGRTIWAPALVHATVQGAIKIVVFPDAALTNLALVWIAACAVLPWLVFLIPHNKTGGVAAAGSG